MEIIKNVIHVFIVINQYLMNYILGAFSLQNSYVIQMGLNLLFIVLNLFVLWCIKELISWGFIYLYVLYVKIRVNRIKNNHHNQQN